MLGAYARDLSRRMLELGVSIHSNFWASIEGMPAMLRADATRNGTCASTRTQLPQAEPAWQRWGADKRTSGGKRNCNASTLVAMEVELRPHHNPELVLMALCSPANVRWSTGSTPGQGLEVGCCSGPFCNANPCQSSHAGCDCNKRKARVLWQNLLMFRAV